MTTHEDARAWFTAATGTRVTAVDLSDILGISRNATNARLAKGLDAEDLIAISRALNISPIHALVDLGKITHEEVFDFLDGDGVLLESASMEQVIYKLATEGLPLSDRITLGAEAKMLADRRDELAERRRATVEPLSDEELEEAVRDANARPRAAHPADDIEYTEPEFP